jgi:hypothetical protein
MSRGWGPKQRRSPPEGVHVAYPLTEAVLARLSPPCLAALCQSLREFCRHVRGHRRLRELERRRLQRRVEDLGSHFLRVDPRNRLVAADLEAKLEGAMRELAAAKAADGHAQPSAPLADADLDDLLMLANDLPALFHATTTATADFLAGNSVSNDLAGPPGHGVMLDVDWADGLVPDSNLLRWVGAPAEITR